MTEILLYGIIGDAWDGLDAKSILAQIQASDDDLLLRINSPGGYVMEGLAVYNVLAGVRASGRKVTVQIDALAASMASVIAMVGEEIIMADNALMMIHNPWDCACGDATELRRKADQLDLIRDQLVKIYSSKTGLSADELKSMLEEETWLTASEALDKKFVTSIVDALGAVGCDVQKFGFRKAPNHPAVQGISWSPAAAAAFFKPGARNMTGTTKPAAPEVSPAPEAPAALTQADIQNAAAAAAAAELERGNGIRALCATHKLDDKFAQELVDSKATLGDARAKVLEKLATASDALQIGQNSTITITQDARDKWLTGAANWLFVKSGHAGTIGAAAKLRGDSVKVDPGEFRGMTLVDLARDALVNAGVANIPRAREAIVKMALEGGARNAITQTTSDFTVLLENVLHKVLQAAYHVAPDTWSRFCGKGSVSDFRPHSRYLKGTFGALSALNEAGEFINVPVPDGAKESLTAVTKGNLVNISRQAIINDDLGAFVDLIVDLARAAKLTIEADVYALIAANPVMNDGVALFHANHGNLAAVAAVPSVASFDAMRVAMASQKDVSGNEYLAIVPHVGLFPIALGGSARVINGAAYDPDTPNKLQMPNRVNGMFSDIVDSPRAAGTAWYGFADPSIAPAIEVAFLDGQEEPFTDSRDGWTVDGIELKVRHDYAVGAVNWRSAQKNAGL